MLNLILKPHSKQAISTIIFLGAFLPLAAALISQYGFGLHPCDLCIYQRIPFIVIMAFSFPAIFLGRAKTLVFVIIMCIFAYMANVGLSFYHMGVEYGWWKFGDCTADLDTSSFEALKASILNAEVVRCDEVQFSFLGLSMAGWNFIYSIASSFYLSYLLYIVAKDTSTEDLVK